MAQQRGRWPTDGDGPLARARKAALAYRQFLLDNWPDVCESVDKLMAKYGQMWAVPRRVGYDAPVGRWPFPGDSATVQARRVAHSYREQLFRVEPKRCVKLDERFTAWGETWVVPRLTSVDLNAWFSVDDAADLALVSVGAIGAARRRGRLVGRHTATGWEYQGWAVLAMSLNKRKRGGSDADCSAL